jgi:hypothetical protein
MAWSIVVWSLTLWHGMSIASLPAQGRTPSGPVGASMALLATLQDAAVLPPEGSPEANRIIQIVIQFQGLFMRSPDPAVREFVDQALASKFADRAEQIGAEFRTGGWTSHILEAICDRYAASSPVERARLAGPFSRANMRSGDFERLSELYSRARDGFQQQGRDIHQIFAEHRRRMPGGKRFDRKERRDGDEGVHTHQGQSGPDEGRLAVLEETCWSGAGALLLWTARYFSLYQCPGRALPV